MGHKTGVKIHWNISQESMEAKWIPYRVWSSVSQISYTVSSAVFKGQTLEEDVIILYDLDPTKMKKETTPFYCAIRWTQKFCPNDQKIKEF